MLDNKRFELDEAELLADFQDGVISKAEYNKAIKELKKYYRTSKPIDKREDTTYE